jgi:hypothetical protein
MIVESWGIQIDVQVVQEGAVVAGLMIVVYVSVREEDRTSGEAEKRVSNEMVPNCRPGPGPRGVLSTRNGCLNIYPSFQCLGEGQLCLRCKRLTLPQVRSGAERATTLASGDKAVDPNRPISHAILQLRNFPKSKRNPLMPCIDPVGSMEDTVRSENFIQGGWVPCEGPNFNSITRDHEVAGPHWT